MTSSEIRQEQLIASLNLAPEQLVILNDILELEKAHALLKEVPF